MRKNKSFFFIFFSFIFLVGIVFAADTALAQLQYQLLEKVPGTDGLGSDLPGYINALYKVALIVIVLSAVLMLSIGGFMYLTSAGNTASMGTAKGVIFDSLIGLVIALFAYLLLYVINPDLVNISIGGLSPSGVPAPAQPGGPPAAAVEPPSSITQAAAARILQNNKIVLNTTGTCKSSSGPVTPAGNIQDVANGKAMDTCYNGCNATSPPCAKNATAPAYLLINATEKVGVNYSFTVTSITGGPHSSTSSHYQGKGMDIVPATGSDWQSILQKFKAAGALSSSFCENPQGKKVACNGGGADHIHLSFP